ncbi:arylsulfatase [Tunicatimonas pelagia]|uniref:arylsulfatase n=1 Tax=Tunicatimonas pelagia TaxID=931531 RepID=UPI00266510A9|nr:arylsulfatase [Tunicatimonas pelagia]WKN44668.1 arylsulfatase [Tunicatimonas pelagia]
MILPYQYVKNQFTWFFLSLLIVNCSPQPETATELESESSNPPNIIYILADDLGYGDLSCYGQTKFSTPNIDKLAQEGMRFTQHYSGNTVCAPSRSALMTGLHTGHTPIRGNKEVRPEGQHPLPDSVQTLAESLREAGYATGAFGKWGLGYPGSEGDPNQQGFDEFFGYNCQRYGHHYYPRHLWHNQDSIVLEENAGKQKGSYAPSLIHREVLGFIEDHQEEPFFLYVPSVIPHAELVAPPEIMAQYQGKYPPETPYEGVDEGENYRTGPYESQEEPHATFVAMISLLDQQVGEIVAKVDSLGLADNTLIIFTSDNGPHQEGGADPDYFDSNGPLKGYKRDLYEGGIRVPMIARWLGKIAAGSESDHVSAFWDVYPTLAELANTESPEGDGVSFVPTLLDSGSQPQHDYLYWEFHEKGGRLAVRQGDWKAVRYNVLENPDSPLELYDLSQDIGEENNVASEHPEVVAEMEEVLKNARTPSPVFTFDQGTYLGAQ